MVLDTESLSRWLIFRLLFVSSYHKRAIQAKIVIRVQKPLITNVFTKIWLGIVKLLLDAGVIIKINCCTNHFSTLQSNGPQVVAFPQGDGTIAFPWYSKI